MPLIAIPTKAEQRYLELCMECWNSTNDVQFNEKCIKEHAYADAIKDICGLDVWGFIVRAADMQFPEGIDACCGIPFNPKYKESPDVP